MVDKIEDGTDQMIAEVRRDKYMLPNEKTWEYTLLRFATGIYPDQVDADAHLELLQLLNQGIVSPAGRPLAGIGSGRNVTAVNCFSGHTSIATADIGAVRLCDVVGESLNLPTKAGNAVPALIRAFGLQWLRRITFAPAIDHPKGIRRSGRSNVRVIHEATKNHRWLLSKGGETTSLQVGDIVPSCAYVPDCNTDAYRSGFRHGLIFGDGSLLDRHVRTGFGEYALRLCGEKKQKLVSAFDGLIAYNDGHDTDHERARVGSPPSCQGDVMVHFYSCVLLKELPISGLPSDYYGGFIHGWFAADGHYSPRDNSFMLTSQNHEALDWLREHAALSNWVVSGDTTSTVMKTNYGERKAPLRFVRLRRPENTHWQVVDIEEDVRKDQVYCAVVPSVGAFTLSSGVYTGNCFVMNEIEDSMRSDKGFGIMDTLSRSAYTMQMGGGIGLCFSPLRPKGANVSRIDADASGPLSFMDMWDAMCRTIMSAGYRRGAMMATLHCDHPDIFDFVDAKTDGKRLRMFNLSVLITDEFMEAVRQDGEWKLGHWKPPHDNDQGYRMRDGKPWYIWRTIKARDLWERIMRQTYVHAEPGVIFIDRVNRLSNLSYCETVTASNPCFTGDTLVWTSEGHKTFRDLASAGKDVQVLSVNSEGRFIYRTMRRPRRTQRMATLVEVMLMRPNGKKRSVDSVIRCTPQHEFYMRDGRRIPAAKLTRGDRIYSVYRAPRGKGYLGLRNHLGAMMEHHVPFENIPGLGIDIDVHHIDENKHNNCLGINHVVKCVRLLNVTEDVYCGTVDETNCFFVALGENDGVLVRNCGEQFLPPNGDCNLGHINLAQCVKNPFTDAAHWDHLTISTAVRAMVRVLDRIIDLTAYPLPEQLDEALAKRRIGLGVTGLATALQSLKVRYGSDEAIAATRMVMHFIANIAYAESAMLAKDHGSFPAYDKEKFLASPFVSKLDSDVRALIAEYGIRNGMLLSIAPTGTTSIAQCDNGSAGIEPPFSHFYSRKVLQGDGSTYKTFHVMDAGYRRFRRMFGEDAPLPDYMVTATELSPEEHVRMLAAAQEWVDNSISKTVNCPESMTFDAFKGVYDLAYDLGCKCCSTHRPDPASGRGSVLSVVDVKPAEIPDKAVLGVSVPGMMEKRPDELEGRTYKIRWPHLEEAVYMTVNDVETELGKRPFEIFLSTKAVRHAEWMTIFTRLVSAVFRRGGDVTFLLDEMKQVQSAEGGAFIGDRMFPSLVAYIGSKLGDHFKRIGLIDSGQEPAQSLEVCPRCNERQFVKSQGCGSCLSCHYSNCG
jgi:ribonucleotide reductase alpha subunit